jgi:hypothetical protein
LASVKLEFPNRPAASQEKCNRADAPVTRCDPSVWLVTSQPNAATPPVDPTNRCAKVARSRPYARKCKRVAEPFRGRGVYTVTGRQSAWHAPVGQPNGNARVRPKPRNGDGADMPVGSPIDAGDASGNTGACASCASKGVPGDSVTAGPFERHSSSEWWDHVAGRPRLLTLHDKCKAFMLS